MIFSNAWGRLKSYMKNIFVPSNILYNSFQAESTGSDKMERALTRWYNMYIDAPEWASEEVRPLGLPKAIAKEFAQVISSEVTFSVDGGVRAEYLNEQLQRFRSGLQPGMEFCMALGGLALKPYVSGQNILIDATSAAAFTPLRFDSGGACVAGVFKSQPVKADRRYYVKLEYHDLTNGLYTIRNKAFSANADGVVSTEVTLDTVPEWAVIAPEVYIQDVEKPLFGYVAPPIANNVDTASGLGASIYSGATEDLIRQADEQWARFLYEFESAERKIMATSEAISGPLREGKPNPLQGERLFVQMPYDSEEFFKEFSPALRNAGFYDGVQAILRRIEFNTGLAYGDLSDPATVEKTATEIISAKTRKYNTVRAAEERLKSAMENVVYGMDVYATLFNLAPAGEYELFIDFDDSILTDNGALREQDRLDVAMGAMGLAEYRAKWYGETEEVAAQRIPAQTSAVLM